ncbi:MAG TPA: hypothetical protein VN541_06835, partial [Tepidisphaeraceae bacterium]|nr:hypothetical protein [Tepidisphaeraceae bacterium]
NKWLADLASELHRRLDEYDAQIAHLKMTLSPADTGNDLAVLNLVGNDARPEMSHQLQEPVESAELILNLRAEADPQVLQSAVLSALDAARAPHGEWNVKVEHMEHFRPGKPQPTHRFAGANQ